MNPPLFSVVLCTYCRYDRLPRAIESVLRQDCEPDTFDIWVMDNAPDGPDRTAFAARYANHPHLHYVLLDRPGLSNARNEGMRQSQGAYVAYLDDDAEATPGWLKAYREALGLFDGKIGAVCGRSLPAFETARPPWLAEEICALYSVSDWGEKPGPLPPHVAPDGMNAIVNREAFLACGQFSTALGRNGPESGSLLSGEETELFTRMRAQDWRFFYTPAATVMHHIPATRMTRAWLRRRIAWQAASDQMKQPLDPSLLPKLFEGIEAYLPCVPAAHRPCMGVFWDTDDPEILKKQLTAIYSLTKMLLAAGKYPAFD